MKRIEISMQRQDEIEFEPMKRQDEIGFELTGSDEIEIETKRTNKIGIEVKQIGNEIGIGMKQIGHTGKHSIELTRHMPLKTQHPSMTYQIMIQVRQIGFKHQLMLDILDLGPDSHLTLVHRR